MKVKLLKANKIHSDLIRKYLKFKSFLQPICLKKILLNIDVLKLRVRYQEFVSLFIAKRWTEKRR